MKLRSQNTDKLFEKHGRKQISRLISTLLNRYRKTLKGFSCIINIDDTHENRIIIFGEPMNKMDDKSPSSGVHKPSCLGKPAESPTVMDVDFHRLLHFNEISKDFFSFPRPPELASGSPLDGDKFLFTEKIIKRLTENLKGDSCKIPSSVKAVGSNYGPHAE